MFINSIVNVEDGETFGKLTKTIAAIIPGIDQGLPYIYS
jgi:hypothetical protein